MTQDVVSWGRVARNVASLILREFLTKGSYLVLGIAIARTMGREAFGDYALSLLLSRSFFTVGDMGFGTWLVREVSQVREEAGRYFATVGVYRLLSGLAVLAGLSGFLFFSRYEVSLKHHIFFSAVAFLLLHLPSFIFSFFRAFEKMGSEFEVTLVKSALLLGGGLWAVSRKSLDLFYGFFILSSAVAFLYALWTYGRGIGWGGFRFAPVRFGGLLPIWLIQSVVMVYLYLDSVLLSFFRGIGEVGLYQAAYSFVDAVLVLSAVLTTALFPVFSRLAKLSLQKLLLFYEELLQTLFFFFVPAGILALFGAKTLLNAFYGPSFQSALPALYMLLAGFFFFIFGGLNGHLLIAMGKEKAVLGIAFVCTFLNLGMNLWAIPRFGFLGASVTTVLSELCMFFLAMRWIVKAFGTASFLEGGSLFWMLSAWTLFLFSLARVSFWIQLPAGIGAYGLLALFFRRKLSKELRAVKALWQEVGVGS